MKLFIQCSLILVVTITAFPLHAITQSVQSSDDELSDEILSAGENMPQSVIESSPDAFAPAIFPLKGGGKIISVFGDPRPNGRVHEGVDIAGPRGDSIIAAWSGVVAFSYWDTLGGWAVKIKHSNGLATYYAHMNTKSTLRPGDKVAQGGYLGPVGNTGDAAGGPTHLHFGIYNGRTAENPMHYIPRDLFLSSSN